MELTRIIHPVGQGGFYSEKLKEKSDVINVIYDCGGNSQKSIESYLENYYPGNSEDVEKTIDAVFISHMHEDHINGLDYLLTQYKVRYLILPQLSEDERLEAFLYNYFDNPNSIANSLLLDRYGDVSSSIFSQTNTRIIEVPKSNSNEVSVGEEINPTDINLSPQNDIENENKKLSNGGKMYFHKWLYIPYNPPRNTELINQKGSFVDFFKERLNIRRINYGDLPTIIQRKGIKKCKKVYTDYFGCNHNSYSMTLFSGVKISDLLNFLHWRLLRRSNYFCKSIRECGYCDYCDPGCFNPNGLFMGDFDTKLHIEGLKTYYSHFWKTIASLQVPHHGSCNNFASQLYETANHGYISVGENNKYYHPNIDTLCGMKENNCEPVLVTEKLSTIKVFHAEEYII